MIMIVLKEACLFIPKIEIMYQCWIFYFQRYYAYTVDALKGLIKLIIILIILLLLLLLPILLLIIMIVIMVPLRKLNMYRMQVQHCPYVHNAVII